MSDERDSVSERYGRALAAEAYPRTENVPHCKELFLRKWICRVKSDLPDDSTTGAFVKALEVKARQGVINATGIETIDERMVAVSANRLGDRYLVLEIICPSPAAKMGDAAAIATSVILRGVDERWHVEDLQGIPKSYWFIMR